MRLSVIDTGDRATMVITDPGDTMGPGSMSDLATATMVGGVGRLGLFTYGLLLTGRGVPSKLASPEEPTQCGFFPGGLGSAPSSSRQSIWAPGRFCAFD